MVVSKKNIRKSRCQLFFWGKISKKVVNNYCLQIKHCKKVVLTISPFAQVYLVSLPGFLTWCPYLVFLPGVLTWCPYLAALPGVLPGLLTWCPNLVFLPGVLTWCSYLVSLLGGLTWCSSWSPYLVS